MQKVENVSLVSFILLANDIKFGLVGEYISIFLEILIHWDHLCFSIYSIKLDKINIIPNKIVPTTIMLSEGEPVQKSTNVWTTVLLLVSRLDIQNIQIIPEKNKIIPEASRIVINLLPIIRSITETAHMHACLEE